VQSHNAWALEDAKNGVRTAVAAGLNVIQLPNLVEPSANFFSQGHTAHTSLHEALSVLKSRNHVEKQPYTICDHR